MTIAARCRFSLEELRYEYPREIVPDGETPSSWLEQLTLQGMRQPLARRRTRAWWWSSSSTSSP